eukprot:1386434-Amphidinium_carterae.2
MQCVRSMRGARQACLEAGYRLCQGPQVAAGFSLGCSWRGCMLIKDVRIKKGASLGSTTTPGKLQL